jgi:hypothetical protein
MNLGYLARPEIKEVLKCTNTLKKVYLRDTGTK